MTNRVDRADAAILAQNYGRTSGAIADQGDLDGNGNVSLNDLAIFQSNFGAVGPALLRRRARRRWRRLRAGVHVAELRLQAKRQRTIGQRPLTV